MAKDYLSVPATSTAIEREFSGGTDLIVPKRSSLKPNAIRKALCTKSWIKLRIIN